VNYPLLEGERLRRTVLRERKAKSKSKAEEECPQKQEMLRTNAQRRLQTRESII
jgi:hypothetical protein